MLAISAHKMRATEQYLFQNHLADSFEMMTAAGKALAHQAFQFKSYGDRYAIFAGKGNNAGDGFIAANIIHNAGYPVIVYLIYSPDILTGDAHRAFRQLSPEIHVLIGLPKDKKEIANAILLDCLLGTGFSGSLRPPYPEWIKFINDSERPVIAADIPSGLNPDDGTIAEIAVKADSTVTFGTVKKGLLLNQGPATCGKLSVADIGIPEELYRDEPEGIPYIAKSDIQNYLNPLNFNLYKHKRGHALIIGGSAHYPFAPLLSGEAALRCTAGMVTVFRPYNLPLTGNCPHALMLSQDSPETSPDGFFSEQSAVAFSSLKTSAIALGMGIGLAESVKSFLATFLRNHSGTPVLLDADALTIIASHEECRTILLDPARDYDIILTPHEGEMQRLESSCGLNSAKSRIQRAVSLAMLFRAYLVFKGPRTIIATPDGTYTVNTSGSPVLATAGSGDVLSGILVSFLATGYQCFEACQCGVWLHGFLGELVQKGPLPMPGIIADDLIALLPNAFQSVMCRI